MKLSCVSNLCLRQYRKSTASVLVIILLAGCAPASLGIRPNQFAGKYKSKSENDCSLHHTSGTAEYGACLDYESTFKWADDLKESYKSRAALNRNAIWVGGVIALASVGVLGGLAAFGEAGSDAAKIIPFAGTFLAGVLALSNNKALAEAYIEAAKAVNDALATANSKIHNNPGGIGRNATAYGPATAELLDAVLKADNELERQRTVLASGNPTLMAERDSLAKENERLKIAVHLKDAKALTVAQTGTTATITFNAFTDLTPFKPEDIKVLIGTQPAYVQGHDKASVTFQVPPPLRQIGTNQYPVHVSVKEVPIPPVPTVALTYP